jgi:GNAT superfamily N-acetyltransferase
MKIREIERLEDMYPTLCLAKYLYAEMSQEEYNFLLGEAYKSGFFRQIVVELNGEIIGLCGYWIGTKVWCGKYIELDHFVVHPDFRSRGVGELIVTYFTQKGKDENCRMLALDAYTDNFPAQRFFMNNGFIPRGFHFIKRL